MRFYKGVFIYGEHRNYTCDLNSEIFKTLREVKKYISDYYKCENNYGNNSGI